MQSPIKRTKINHLLLSETPVDTLLVKGWVRTRRDARGFSFLEVNDGSCLKNIQVITGAELPNYTEIRKITTGSAIAVSGSLVASQGAGQKWEIHAEAVEIINLAPDNYPLQKKRHGDEFLRSIAHLRPRTNKYGAAFRLRSELSYAIHHFFKQRGFRYIHTPIITGSDCEGAGELFRVTTMEPGQRDFSLDFFGTEAGLTVSGQLNAEMFALSLGDVYTFGPTFRAENSNTSRHVAEFWMVEPEMAFCDLTGNMDFAEEMLQRLTSYMLENCFDDLELFARFVEKGLLTTLESIVNHPFERVTYAAAIKILADKGRKFQYPVEFGKDLQSEHERFLTEDLFRRPVIIFDYPKTIKPFYMRLNDDDHTVAAMDVLVPRVGEIIGGSQREERLEVLQTRMQEMGMNLQDYWWYIDSRRFGSVPHSGFGLGFERLLMLLTGISNIRDVIPFPRTPGGIDF